MRRFAIGDIHGCSKALRTLIERIEPTSDDELVFLGDYVDRGPDSKNVIDQIIELRRHCRVVALRGNHEVMLTGVVLGGLTDSVWLENGGRATVSSYGGSIDKIPPDHLLFFQQLLPYYETEQEIFVHAGYDPFSPMHCQTEGTLYWEHLPWPPPPPHQCGKRVVVGHTPQPSGEVLDLGHLVCLDTYCVGRGYLSALEMQTGMLIQSNRSGHLRRAPIANAFLAARKWSAIVLERCRRLAVKGPDAGVDDSVIANEARHGTE